MPFVSLLRPEQIAIAPAWRGFGNTVDGLLGRLTASGLLSATSGAEAASAVRAREAEASTAVLEIGVGVPHARVGGLEHPVVALDEHLRALADIATLLHSAELRALLIRATDAPAALDGLARYARGMP
jgi:mannitol/fructose-specific phosphotransferase system IIA component (Ntr-type)